ncbi:hypothetical protein VTH06DRAFT_5247 [Thermothelomyces fergusii]
MPTVSRREDCSSSSLHVLFLRTSSPVLAHNFLLPLADGGDSRQRISNAQAPGISIRPSGLRVWQAGRRLSEKRDGTGVGR